MAKLMRVEFIRRDNGGWMVYEKFEDGAEQGGPVGYEEARHVLANAFGETNTEPFNMDLVKESDEASNNGS
ncbi:hypothetical protein HWB79_gp200 [Streptomyces phage LukeCage]|jgi:hypothetical protein|uniref:Uncharacterized protein n=1 Tax=Streptomyces phage LukeCage TaxID=2283304 RepID=A0A345MGD2_9CAUD|nr:hypothetical protein HWB79_gp200 [Streptomyces phage LukeCage]AXH69613.1 hypothetical protein SEA_LUKECAGE_87 [Streptomyces phage LukeCage]